MTDTDQAEALPPAAIVKRCGCGRTFTIDQWNALKLRGWWGDTVETLEMRNCSGCGSTIAISVEVQSAKETS